MNGLTQTQYDLLELLSCALFGVNTENTLKKKAYDWNELKAEALSHTVFTLIYPLIKDHLPDELQQEWKLQNFKILKNNLKIDIEHTELHGIMTENRVLYTTIKGCASASYYSEPEKRTMGDVDFLVRRSELERVGALLKAVGFTENKNSSHPFHTEYYREKSCWELHYSMGGIPENKIGERIIGYLEDTIDDSKLIEFQGIKCRVPSDFHHGLIMLLHLIEHTNNDSGFGLRHLCDWAVYADRVDPEQYSEQLSELGLWTFARQLTALCSKYLGLKKYDYIDDFSDEFLGEFIYDIISCGNFGEKDKDRSTGINMVKDSNIFVSLAERTKFYYPFFRKHKFLLPIGAIMFLFRFLGQRISGKRNWVTVDTIRSAKSRRKLHEQFKLFETQ